MSKKNVNVDDVFSGTFKSKVTDLSKQMIEFHLSNSDKSDYLYKLKQQRLVTL